MTKPALTIPPAIVPAAAQPTAPQRLATSHSPTESARFGVGISRLSVTQAQLPKVLASLGPTLAACPDPIVILRYPSSATTVVGALPQTDWDLYPAGTTLDWEGPVRADPIRRADQTCGELSPAEFLAPGWQATLLAALDRYPTHYAVNPQLDDELIAVGYQEWAANVAGNPAGFVVGVSRNSQPAGVFVCQVTDGAARFIIGGVDPQFRNQGVYAGLLDAVMTAAAHRQLETFRASTQAHNLTVQRQWAARGCRPIEAMETVHLVRHSVGGPQ